MEENEAFGAGKCAGCIWACERGNLCEDVVKSLSSQTGTPEAVFASISANSEGMEEFWRHVAGEPHPSSEFLKGFARGVVESAEALLEAHKEAHQAANRRWKELQESVSD